MNYNEFQQQAKLTAIYPKERALEYTVLGLQSEVGELAGAYLKAKSEWFAQDWDNVIKELGDLFWYIAAILTELDISMEETFGDLAAEVNTRTERSRGFTVVRITEHAGEVAGAVKKFFRDETIVGDTLDAFYGTPYEQKLLGHLRALITQGENLAAILDTDISTVLTLNANKLKDRQDRGVLAGSGDNR